MPTVGIPEVKWTTEQMEAFWSFTGMTQEKFSEALGYEGLTFYKKARKAGRISPRGNRSLTRLAKAMGYPHPAFNDPVESVTTEGKRAKRDFRRKNTNKKLPSGRKWRKIEDGLSPEDRVKALVESRKPSVS